MFYTVLVGPLENLALLDHSLVWLCDCLQLTIKYLAITSILSCIVP